MNVFKALDVYCLQKGWCTLYQGCLRPSFSHPPSRWALHAYIVSQITAFSPCSSPSPRKLLLLFLPSGSQPNHRIFRRKDCSSFTPALSEQVVQSSRCAKVSEALPLQQGGELLLGTFSTKFGPRLGHLITWQEQLQGGFNTSLRIAQGLSQNADPWTFGQNDT